MNAKDISYIVPCPWCGGKDLIDADLGCADREGTPMAMRCECGAQAPWQYIPDHIADKEVIYLPMLIKTWNERAAK